MRPINKRNFGNAGIAVKFYDGSAVVSGYVVKQTGWKKFRVAKADGSGQKVCRLAQTVNELTALTAGTGPDAAKRALLCTMEVAVFGGATENIKNIYSAKVHTIQESKVRYQKGVTADATGEGTVTLVGAGGSSRPAWLHADATMGINFQTSEAWVNNTLITNFSTIFGANFSAARLSASGYNQTDGGGGMRVIGPLFTALQSLNWAYRFEVNLVEQGDSHPQIMTGYDATNSDGFDHELYYFDTGIYSPSFSDYGGNYNQMPNIGLGPHVFAVSNNVGGWSASVDGGAVVTNAPQSTFTPEFISMGSNINSVGDVNETLRGTLKKWEFFPPRTNAELIALSV